MPNEKIIINISLDISVSKNISKYDLDNILNDIKLRPYSNECIEHKNIIGYWDNIYDCENKSPIKSITTFNFVP